MPKQFERRVVHGILVRLAQEVAARYSGWDAGVTLRLGGTTRSRTASSDQAAGDFERRQVRLREGPSLTAFSTGQFVRVDDLAGDQRYPRLAAASLGGAAAAFSFPLRHGETCLGALTLTRDVPCQLDEQMRSAVQALADVAAAHLLSATARRRALAVSDGYRESSLHDALTGLPNRLLLQQRLEHAARRAQRSHCAVAVLFADLDRFKSVNDTYGHAVGDELLVAVAERLEALVRPGDTLARVSGDEFVVLCEDFADPDDVERLAVRIGDCFTAPFLAGGILLHCTASVGIAYSGPGESVTDQLVVDADMAMYQAKKQGGAVHKVIDLRDAQDVHDRTRLEQDLHGAASRGELALWYQPIVRSRDGLVTGVEALLRWTHPVSGPVPALVAVGVAERNGLIGEIGAWVLEQGCRDRALWLAAHPERPLSLSVNVSALQLMGLGFAADVRDVLAATGMDPAALVLEVTEGVFIEDADRALGVLDDLKALGVALALDDFGTGYCSLGYLRRFPVDVVKIDQGFIADIGRDPAGVAIVGAVTTLAHALGMRVTAEGIETEQQRAEVDSIGCESSQGFLFARPMTGDDLVVHLGRAPGRPLLLPPERAHV
ncbi:MAG: hypothetical protein JWN17_1964 [Frankiales bacterium]|nr:hypothetical protein [Frankiales bacterium]